MSIDMAVPLKGASGPAIVAAASGLMLLPKNASRWIRLHRLAALGVAGPADGSRTISPSAIRSLLKRSDIGGQGILWQEDPYSEVFVQAVSFHGGSYLVSPGSGEHTVTDLEGLLQAAFHDAWMPAELRGRLRYLVQGLLTVSDLVLKRGRCAAVPSLTELRRHR